MAIAVDTQKAFTFSNSGTMTEAYTCSGSNRILFVGGFMQSSSATCAYNGSSMTEIGRSEMPTLAGYYTYLWMLVAPSTGSNNVVISSAGGYCASWASSYTGAKQTGQPDASTTTTVNTGATLTSTLTTIDDNSWCVMAAAAYQGATSAGASTTYRIQYSNWGGNYDTNGAVTPAGSRSLVATSSFGSGEKYCSVMASFSPANTASPSSSPSASPSSSPSSSPSPSHSPSSSPSSSPSTSSSSSPSPSSSLSLSPSTSPSSSPSTSPSTAWENEDKNTTIWIDDSKSSSSWNNETKNTSTFINQSKNGII